MTQQHTPEPFGYFRAEPFGWVGCDEFDEGAVALYHQTDIDKIAKQRDELLARLDVVCEVHVISQTYVRIREEKLFAADDLEYDLFAAGWKAAIASVKGGA